jgi:hypothetical protein
MNRCGYDDYIETWDLIRWRGEDWSTAKRGENSGREAAA